MAYPSAHYLLTYGGTLLGPETWTQGLRVWFEDMSRTQAEEEADLAAFAAVLAAWWPSQTISGAAVRLSWAKFNKIGVDGHYVNQYTNLHEWTAPGIASPNQGPLYPNQVSLVVSLTTNVARGLACRGRLYFYAGGIAVETDGRIGTTAQTSVTTKAKDLLDDLNGATDGVLVVASNVREGAIRLIEGIKVGRVLDTMRSRRTSLDEGYSTSAVDLGGWAGGGGPF